MKAVVYEKYGPPEVLELRELAKPRPADNEVLVRTYVTTVTTGDWRARSLEMPRGFGPFGRLFFGVTGPRQQILGTELAGRVEAVGKNVKRFKPDDEVFAFFGAAMGCYAEYKCVREDGPITLKPKNLTFEQAAALSFGGINALGFLRRAQLKKGESVLIIGASGGVGTAAVQIARNFEANVTGVCSGANVDLVRSLGATQVVDYTKEDFTTNGERYDIIFDTTGTAPFSRSEGSLKNDGRFIPVLGGMSDLLRAPWTNATSKKTIVAGPSRMQSGDLRFLAGLAESGSFTPVIDRRFELEQIVEAHRYVDTGRKRGNVVVTI